MCHQSSREGLFTSAAALQPLYWCDAGVMRTDVMWDQYYGRVVGTLRARAVKIMGALRVCCIFPKHKIRSFIKGRSLCFK